MSFPSIARTTLLLLAGVSLASGCSSSSDSNGGDAPPAVLEDESSDRPVEESGVPVPGAPLTQEPAAPDAQVPDPSAPATEAPGTDAPIPDAPETGELDREAPETEAPASEAPETDTPVTETPVTETPATDTSETGEPEQEAPETETPAPEAPVGETPTADTPATDAPDPVVPDPEVQSSTRVDVDITVPAYMSNALMVSVEWRIEDDPEAGVEVSAAWNGDEFWSASAELATDTDYRLSVTFLDDNGGIVLGRVRTQYKTGTNASESVSIAADRFETDAWDDDGDGKSNLAESIAGTDPAVDEMTLLPVRETFHADGISDALFTLQRTSAYYESSIPAERPYTESTERPPTENCLSGRIGLPVMRIVDIDEAGTGSFDEQYFCDDFGDRTRETLKATRTRIDGKVTWSGTYARSNSSSGVYDDVDFTSDSETLDGRNRRQVGTIVNNFLGSFEPNPRNEDIRYELTGEILDDSAMCEPIAGTVTIDLGEPSVGVTTIAKAEDDRYWAVRAVNDAQTVDEYQILSLGITFQCVVEI